MFLPSWLRRRSADRNPEPRANRRPTARFRPHLEALDDRLVPAQINLTVTSLADAGPGALRDAILTADAGSHSDKFTIDFSVTGTIDLQTPLPDLNNSIAIQGPGVSQLTVERAAGASFASVGPIVSVDPNQTASLSGLTIANGDGGGIGNNGTLTLANCAVLNNSSDFYGGIVNNGTMTITGCTVAGNSSGGDGGGIYNALSTRPFSNPATLTVAGSAITQNTAPGIGGGVFNRGGTVTISASSVCGNTAHLGGSIDNEGQNQFLAYTGTLAIDSSTISGNTASSNGGGIYNSGGALTVSASTLSANTAGFAGGGIFTGANVTAAVTITGSTLCGNSASNYGGALMNDVGEVTVSDSSMSANTAVAGGGVANFSSMTLSGSSFTHNIATYGGGIYNLATQRQQALVS